MKLKTEKKVKLVLTLTENEATNLYTFLKESSYLADTIEANEVASTLQTVLRINLTKLED